MSPTTATQDTYQLTPEEQAALVQLANNLAFKKAEVAEKRSQLETQISEIDREVAHANGMAQGGLRLILSLHGLEGDWQLEADGKLVRQPSQSPV